MSSDLGADPLQSRAVRAVQKPQNGSDLGKVEPRVFTQTQTTLLQYFRSTHFLWIKDVL